MTQIPNEYREYIDRLNAQLAVPCPDGDFEFTVKASVFECGNGYYCVVWATNQKGTGRVSYTYDGKDYSVNDQTLGNINTSDTIHCVRVPKKHLDLNSYRYHSRPVMIKLGYFALQDEEISSEPVDFIGFHSQAEIKVLVLSDIHGNLSDAEAAIEVLDREYDCEKVGTSADLLILNGDISSELIFKSDFVSTVLNYAYKLSGGRIPVAYARGNHEARGEFAPALLKYFPYGTGGMYYSFNYGPIKMLVLDTGEDKSDNHIEYSGLVDFFSYIAQENLWLESLEPDSDPDILHRLCIAHHPQLDNRYGNDWTGELERLGTDLLLCGHTHTFELFPKLSFSSRIRTVIEGGKTEEGFIATMLSVSGNEIKLDAADCFGNIIVKDETVKK